ARGSAQRRRAAAPDRAVACRSGGAGEGGGAPPRLTGPRMTETPLGRAPAALLRARSIIGCASEERFRRLKNDAGYPRRAIDALLRECGVTPDQIDVVTLAGARAASREWLNRVLHDEAYAREYYGVSW